MSPVKPFTPGTTGWSASDLDDPRIEAKWERGRARVYVPPTIVIESISPGHQAHDRVTKFGWYAEFGVKHFWILDPYAKTLDAFVLARGKYKKVANLKGNAPFRPAAFAGVEINLADVWPQD